MPQARVNHLFTDKIVDHGGSSRLNRGWIVSIAR
jgi:hypothetical protein